MNLVLFFLLSADKILTDFISRRLTSQRVTSPSSVGLTNCYHGQRERREKVEEEILNFELRATKSGSYSNFKEDMIVAVVMIFLATAY